MMSQVYFLELVYLTLSGMLLLSDSHGVKFPILLSLRYAFRQMRWYRVLMTAGGFVLGLLSMFVPYEPGPALLGDFVVTLTIFPLVVWFFSWSRQLAQRPKKGATVVDEAALVIEQNKRLCGKIVFVVAVVHFFVPMIVLL